jgi:hypothetical protein
MHYLKSRPRDELNYSYPQPGERSRLREMVEPTDRHRTRSVTHTVHEGLAAPGDPGDTVGAPPGAGVAGAQS